MSTSLNPTHIIDRLDTTRISIIIVWLFHITAVLGISLGYFDFFVPKTPINLLIAISLLVLNFKIDTLKKVSLMLLFFSLGMLAEWIGVHNDFLFGAYSYGENLGWKLDGVPYLIGINWAILVFVTGAIANKLVDNRSARVILGAFLMVLLDFVMEVSAPIFDFWNFSNGTAPLQNYIAWFVIASILHFIFQYYKVSGNTRFSAHLYGAQFVFFSYFALYYLL